MDSSGDKQHDVHSEKVIVTLSGKQSPGALASVMHVLCGDDDDDDNDDAQLVDFGQIVVRSRFVATALIATARAQHDAMKDVLLRAHRAAMNVHFTAATTPTRALAHYQRHANHFVLTLFSPARLCAALLARLTHSVLRHGATIDAIAPLRAATPAAQHSFVCVQLRLSVRGDAATRRALQRELFELGRGAAQCDVALQRATASRTPKRLAVFDLSWTLVQCDALDALLRAGGVQVPAEAARRFAAGELDDAQWVRLRAALLRNVPAAAATATAVRALRLTDGARELCAGLRRRGCRLAVVSSGPEGVARAAGRLLDVDYVFGNTLETDAAGRFTGTVRAPVVDARRKAALVAMLAMQERVGLEQVVAVGDGPVSARMLRCAGMAVGFDQVDAVRAVRSGRIGSKSLRGLLYMVGAGAV